MGVVSLATGAENDVNTMDKMTTGIVKDVGTALGEGKETVHVDVHIFHET